MNRILKGQMGHFEDDFGSTVYGVKGQQDFIDDCVTLGFEVRELQGEGRMFLRAYDKGVGTGEWCPKTGGMIAFSI